MVKIFGHAAPPITVGYYVVNIGNFREDSSRQGILGPARSLLSRF
jgi:hypothetical protein